MHKGRGGAPVRGWATAPAVSVSRSPRLDAYKTDTTEEGDAGRAGRARPRPRHGIMLAPSSIPAPAPPGGGPQRVQGPAASGVAAGARTARASGRPRQPLGPQGATAQPSGSVLAAAPRAKVSAG